MRCTRFIAAIGLLFQAACAGAVCPVNPPHYRVGDMASHAACNYDSIQAAINAAGTCPVVIDVTREHQYTGGSCTPGQTTTDGCHLAVNGKSITLQGWPDSVTCYSLSQSVCPTCGPDRTDPLVTLDANNNGTLLSVSGASNVSLRNLTLSHGNAGTFNGGGILFSGSGSLNLYATTINLNQATNGAGIEFNGSGGNATLTLGANTQILANTASGSGGGIRIEGSARLLALQPQTQIAFNHAPNGYGGGVQALGPAQVDIGSPGYGSGGVIFFNDAQYGGGIAALAQENKKAIVRLFTTDARSPARVSNNTASRTGGGIFLKPHDNGSDTTLSILCARDFRIDNNIAQEGTAIYDDLDFFAGWMYLNADDDQCRTPEPMTDLGAVACTAGVACNEIDHNVAEDDSGTPTTGSTVLVQAYGYLGANRVRFDGNRGAHLVRGIGVSGGNGMFLNHCLIDDNQMTGEPFFESGVDTLHLGIRNCTLANDAIGGSAAILGDSHSRISLVDSIVDEPGVPTLAYTGTPANLDVEYVLANDASLTGLDGAFGEPIFVDPANGDYHLTPVSLGIDYAPAAGGADLDGNPRDWDLPAIGNVYGSRDLGAYERQNLFNGCGSSDSVFCDGFEATP